MRLIQRIANNVRRQAAQQLDYTAQSSTRRSRRELLDTFNDSVDATIAAIRGRRQAEAERDHAVALVRHFSAKSEAYRRAVAYLTRAWQPIDPTEPTANQAQVDEWLLEIIGEVEADGAWTQSRDAEVQQELLQARERAK
jgi:hypothetical protein